MRVLHQAACSLLRIGEWSVGSQFHRMPLDSVFGEARLVERSPPICKTVWASTPLMHRLLTIFAGVVASRARRPLLGGDVNCLTRAAAEIDWKTVGLGHMRPMRRMEIDQVSRH